MKHTNKLAPTEEH